MLPVLSAGSFLACVLLWGLAGVDVVSALDVMLEMILSMMSVAVVSAVSLIIWMGVVSSALSLVLNFINHLFMYNRATQRIRSRPMTPEYPCRNE